MAGPRTAPYGSWRSPVTPALVAAGSLRLDQVTLDGDAVYWLELRPAEGGRSVVVRRTPDGRTTDMTPPSFSARTLVHEYGGGAMAVSAGTVYFSNFEDQRVYRTSEAAPPAPVTPAGPLRYADGVVDARRGRFICVREDHITPGREAINTLVSLDLQTGDAAVLASGHDFYSSPRLSPDGTRLAWLAWNHPNMPWDGTELWIGELAPDGALRGAAQVAGGAAESIFQPEWSPDGVLHFVSDRMGWWNLYRWRGGHAEPLCPMSAEFGVPQWVFGLSTYGFESAARIICAYQQGGSWHLARLDVATGALEPFDLPYSVISGLRVGSSRAVFSAGSPDGPAEIAAVSLATRRLVALRRASDAAVDAGYLSAPQAIEFPTDGGLTAHAFYYAPRNRDHAGPPGERPPLLVRSHGGPTSFSPNTLNLETQYWTSRGLAVLDVNYGGSTGYGRAYRERLYGQWGIVDVRDCEHGARYLVERGLADGARLAIRGGSAGGYTTLRALTMGTAFTAGASHYGISDLEIFDQETHKFESRYDTHLIGPWPERRDLYRERSPIRAIDRLSVPLILFQGLEDKIVPPNQAEMMFDAARRKGIPVAYVPFAGEQHGWRRAETIRRALEAELYFYSRIFRFAPADPVEPVPIENLQPAEAVEDPGQD